jgi:hypothetical protein
MKINERRPNWACGSSGPQNNNHLKECAFSFWFDDVTFGNPHCPVCGQIMQRIEAPNSVSNLLRKGAKEGSSKK